MSHHHATRRWAQVVLAVVLVVAGLVLTLRHHRDDPAAPTAEATPTAVVTATPAPAPAPVPVAETRTKTKKTSRKQPRPRQHPGVPQRLVVPSLGVDAPVVPISARGGVLVPPSDPQMLGWWAQGARPGAARGSALITGHTVHTGGGAFDHLGTVPVGSLMVVRTPGQRLSYVVRSVRTYTKGRISSDASRLFSQDVPGRLVVITCSDYDGTEYLSNTVVTAVLRNGPKHEARPSAARQGKAPSVTVSPLVQAFER